MLTFASLVVPAVVEDAAKDLLANVFIIDTDNVLRVVVTIFIRYNIGRFHVPRVKMASGARHGSGVPLACAF